jgi:hypothetical protein
VTELLELEALPISMSELVCVADAWSDDEEGIDVILELCKLDEEESCCCRSLLVAEVEEISPEVCSLVPREL